MKKLISVIMVLTILTLSGAASFAEYKDVPRSADYYNAVDRVTSLGLMDEAGSDIFKPLAVTTREQFAKIIISAAGLGDEAEAAIGTTIFSDVPYDGEYNGYINLSISKGYMFGMADGKFHPKDAVTFSQAVTAMVKVLEYTAADVPGTWPKNYMEKAKALGLSKGLSLNANSSVPRWAMAKMLDVLLDTKVKAGNGADSKTPEEDKTLAEVSGLTLNTMFTVYSKPEVYYKSELVNSKLGSIDLSGKLSIVRNSADNSTNPATVTNGEAIKVNEINDYEVVYQVSDKMGKNKYVLVIDNKITGKITGILPNKYAPQQVEVNGKAYSFDKNFDNAKLSGYSSFNLNDNVTLLLGYDGKVIDIKEALYSDNSGYAFVENYSSFISNDPVSYGARKFTVKLLLTDGSVITYDTGSDPSLLKGKIVAFTKNTEGSVTLTNLDYTEPAEVYVNKADRKILSNSNNYSNDISGNVKIYKLISNEAGKDALAQLISWGDMPSGTLRSGQVLFMNKTGEFEDINLILLGNVSAAGSRLGIVKSITNQSTPRKTSFNYNINIGGTDYQYAADSNAYGISTGTVVKVNMQGNNINNIVEVKYPDLLAYSIQAADKERVRAGSKTYTLADNCVIYLMDSIGNLQLADTSDLRTDVLYNKVEVYSDIPLISGGKAELILTKNN